MRAVGSDLTLPVGFVQGMGSSGAGLGLTGFNPISIGLRADTHTSDAYLVGAKTARIDFVIDGLTADMVPLAEPVDRGIER